MFYRKRYTCIFKFNLKHLGYMSPKTRVDVLRSSLDIPGEMDPEALMNS